MKTKATSKVQFTDLHLLVYNQPDFYPQKSTEQFDLN
uniref:Uncharacterized protein n=1 Tax=Arundo donax TaxID=35708 RepID=A0A0A8ZYD8_ARUDO